MRKGKFNELFIPKQNVMQPDVFANIPNPSNIALPIVNEMNDYSSINKRLDKLASGQRALVVLGDILGV